MWFSRRPKFDAETSRLVRERETAVQERDGVVAQCKTLRCDLERVRRELGSVSADVARLETENAILRANLKASDDMRLAAARRFGEERAIVIRIMQYGLANETWADCGEVGPVDAESVVTSD